MESTLTLAAQPEHSAAAGMIGSLMRANASLQADLQRSRDDLATARAGIAEAGDVVRRKLGQDLHDGAQQRLTVIQIMAALAQERAGDDELAVAIESIGTLAAQAADDLRDLTHGIYPVLLTYRGPVEALRAVARTSPRSIRVLDDDFGRSSAAVEAALYFCALEAIQNATKHAGEDARVTVTIGREPDGLWFEVADDGVGMRPPPHRDGIGLRCMRDRLEALGGRFEISSSPGVGTRVRGRLPDVP
jgi:signal transduction histidine kinase